MITILKCDCGHEQEAEGGEERLGRAYRCKGCRRVWAHLYPKNGGRAWVEISEQDATFHDLLGERISPDDED